MKSKGRKNGSGHAWGFPYRCQTCKLTEAQCNGTKASGSCIHGLEVTKWGCAQISLSKLNHWSAWCQTPTPQFTSPFYKLSLKAKSDSDATFPSAREEQYQLCWDQGCPDVSQACVHTCATSDAPGCASPPIGLWWIPPSPFFIALDSLSMHHLLLASAAYCLSFVCTLELSAASPAAFTTSLPLLRLLRVLLSSCKRTESCCWILCILSSSGHLPCTLLHWIAGFPVYLSCLFLCLSLVWSNNLMLLNRSESGSDPDVKRSGPVYVYII